LNNNNDKAKDIEEGRRIVSHDPQEIKELEEGKPKVKYPIAKHDPPSCCSAICDCQTCNPVTSIPDHPAHCGCICNYLKCQCCENRWQIKTVTRLEVGQLSKDSKGYQYFLYLDG
jgi:hypothetical protein